MAKKQPTIIPNDYKDDAYYGNMFSQHMNNSGFATDYNPYQMGQQAYQQSQTDANQNGLDFGGNDTVGNGFLGSLIDSAQAGAASSFGGTARFLGEFSPVGKDAFNGFADTMDEIARNNTPLEKPEGANYVAGAIGNAIGSGGAAMAEAAIVAGIGAALGIGSGAAAGAMGVGGLVGRAYTMKGSMAAGKALGRVTMQAIERTPALGHLARAAESMWKSGFGTKIMLGEVFGSPFEAMAEAGNLITEMRQEGYSDDEIRSSAIKSAAYNTAWLTVANIIEGKAGMAIQGATNVGSKLGKVAMASVGDAAGEGMEEFGQNLIGNVAKGEELNYDEAKEAAIQGAIGGAFLGGGRQAIESYLGNNNNSAEESVAPTQDEMATKLRQGISQESQPVEQIAEQPVTQPVSVTESQPQIVQGDNETVPTLVIGENGQVQPIVEGGKQQPVGGDVTQPTVEQPTETPQQPTDVQPLAPTEQEPIKEPTPPKEKEPIIGSATAYKEPKHRWGTVEQAQADLNAIVEDVRQNGKNYSNLAGLKTELKGKLINDLITKKKKSERRSLKSIDELVDSWYGKAKAARDEWKANNGKGGGKTNPSVGTTTVTPTTVEPIQPITVPTTPTTTTVAQPVVDTPTTAIDNPIVDNPTTPDVATPTVQEPIVDKPTATDVGNGEPKTIYPKNVGKETLKQPTLKDHPELWWKNMNVKPEDIAIYGNWQIIHKDGKFLTSREIDGNIDMDARGSFDTAEEAVAFIEEKMKPAIEPVVETPTTPTATTVAPTTEPTIAAPSEPTKNPRTMNGKNIGSTIVVKDDTEELVTKIDDERNYTIKKKKGKNGYQLIKDFKKFNGRDVETLSFPTLKEAKFFIEEDSQIEFAQGDFKNPRHLMDWAKRFLGKFRPTVTMRDDLFGARVQNYTDLTPKEIASKTSGSLRAQLINYEFNKERLTRPKHLLPTTKASVRGSVIYDNEFFKNYKGEHISEVEFDSLEDAENFIEKGVLPQYVADRYTETPVAPTESPVENPVEQPVAEPTESPVTPTEQPVEPTKPTKPAKPTETDAQRNERIAKATDEKFANYNVAKAIANAPKEIRQKLQDLKAELNDIVDGENGLANSQISEYSLNEALKDMNDTIDKVFKEEPLSLTKIAKDKIIAAYDKSLRAKEKKRQKAAADAAKKAGGEKGYSKKLTKYLADMGFDLDGFEAKLLTSPAGITEIKTDREVLSSDKITPDMSWADAIEVMAEKKRGSDIELISLSSKAKYGVESDEYIAIDDYMSFFLEDDETEDEDEIDTGNAGQPTVGDSGATPENGVVTSNGTTEGTTPAGIEEIKGKPEGVESGESKGGNGDVTNSGITVVGESGNPKGGTEEPKITGNVQEPTENGGRNVGNGTERGQGAEDGMGNGNNGNIPASGGEQGVTETGREREESSAERLERIRSTYLQGLGIEPNDTQDETVQFLDKQVGDNIGDQPNITFAELGLNHYQDDNINDLIEDVHKNNGMDASDMFSEYIEWLQNMGEELDNVEDIEETNETTSEDDGDSLKAKDIYDAVEFITDDENEFTADDVRNYVESLDPVDRPEFFKTLKKQLAEDCSNDLDITDGKASDPENYSLTDQLNDFTTAIGERAKELGLPEEYEDYLTDISNRSTLWRSIKENDGSVYYVDIDDVEAPKKKHKLKLQVATPTERVMLQQRNGVQRKSVLTPQETKKYVDKVKNLLHAVKVQEYDDGIFIYTLPNGDNLLLDLTTDSASLIGELSEEEKVELAKAAGEGELVGAAGFNANERRTEFGGKEVRTIHLTDLVNEDTPTHEVMHLAYDLYTTNDEKRTLRNYAIKQLKAELKDIYGNKWESVYSKMTPQERTSRCEEIIADGLVEYIANENTGSVIRKIARKILRALARWANELGVHSKTGIYESVKKGDVFNREHPQAERLMNKIKAQVVGTRENKNLNNELFDKAKKMKDDGKDMRDIFIATGFFEDVDGKWKTWIDDNYDNFDYSKLPTVDGQEITFGEIYNNPDLFAAYPELKDIKLIGREMQGGLQGSTKGKESLEFRINRDGLKDIEMQKKYPNMLIDVNGVEYKFDGIGYWSKSMNLFSIRKHKEFAKGEIGIETLLEPLQTDLKIYQGFVDDNWGDVEHWKKRLSETKADIEKIKSIKIKKISLEEILDNDKKEVCDTVFHEMQHIIQDMEGFASGGSSDFIDIVIGMRIGHIDAAIKLLSNYDKQIKKLEASLANSERYLKEYSDPNDSNYNPKKAEDYKKYVANDKEFLERARKYGPKVQNKDAEIKRLQKEKADLEAVRRDIQDDFEKYQHLHGEQEARRAGKFGTEKTHYYSTNEMINFAIDEMKKSDYFKALSKKTQATLIVNVRRESRMAFSAWITHAISYNTPEHLTSYGKNSIGGVSEQYNMNNAFNVAHQALQEVAEKNLDIATEVLGQKETYSIIIGGDEHSSSYMPIFNEIKTNAENNDIEQRTRKSLKLQATSAKTTEEKLARTTVTSRPQTLSEKAKAIRSNPTSYIADLWKKFYIDWVDKNDMFKDIDKLHEKVLGRKLKSNEKIYGRAQGITSTANGVGDVLIGGDAEELAGINKRLKNKKLKHPNGTMKHALENLKEDKLDNDSKNFMKRYGFKDAVEALGSALTWRRLREMARQVENAHKQWEHEKKLMDAWEKKREKYNSLKEQALAALEDGKQVTINGKTYTSKSAIEKAFAVGTSPLAQHHTDWLNAKREWMKAHEKWRKAKKQAERHNQPFTDVDPSNAMKEAWKNKCKQEHWVETTAEPSTQVGEEPIYKLPGDLTAEELDKGIASIPKQFLKACDDYYDMNDNILCLLEDANVIDNDLHELLNTTYKEYCPLQRDSSDTQGLDEYLAGFGAGGSGPANVSNMIKEISKEGSKKTVINPLETTVKTAMMAARRAERNKVALKLIELADVPGMETVVKRVDPVGYEKDGSPKYPAADPRYSTFTVMENGQKVTYQTSPEYYQAIVGYDEPSSNIVWDSLSIFAQFLRTGATMTPSFIVRNGFRDSVLAGYMTNVGFKPIIGTINGIRKLHAKTGKEAELNAIFKSMGFGSMTRERDGQAIYDNLQKQVGSDKIDFTNPISLWNAFKDWFVGLNEDVELGTRRELFGLAMDKYGADFKAGKISYEDLIQMAAEIGRFGTTDFTRSGIKGQQVNRVSAFFNANVQGVDLYVQGLKNPETRARMLGFIGTYIGLPCLAIWAANHDKDWWKELDPQVKYTNFCVSEYFRVPLPQEAGVMFGGGLMAILDMAMDNDPKAMKIWGHAVKESLCPNPIPTVLTPIMEWQANYSFFKGRPIVNQRLQKLPDDMQYDNYTTELSKMIGKVANLSPKKLDNTVKGIGATLGIQGWDVLGDALVMAMGDNKVRPDKDFREKVFVRDFNVTEGIRGRYTNDFYELWSEASKLKSAGRTTRKQEKAIKSINAAQRTISKLNKEIRMIGDPENTRLTSSQKQEMLAIRREKIKRIAKQAIDKYGSYFE